MVRVTAVTYGDGTEDTVLETCVTVTVREQRKTSPWTAFIFSALAAVLILLSAAAVIYIKKKKGPVTET